MTAFAAKDGAIIVRLVGTHVFGAPDTVLAQWIAAVLIGALGLAATAHEIGELWRQKGQVAASIGRERVLRDSRHLVSWLCPSGWVTGSALLAASQSPLLAWPRRPPSLSVPQP